MEPCLLARSSCKKWARQKVWGQAVPWLRNISCSGHLCHCHDRHLCFCVCLCVLCDCVCILLYMFNIWVDVWLSLHYVIVAQVCMKDVLSVELILNMWKRELWQSGWLERSFVWQRGPCHILVKAFSVFSQTLISRLEKYGTGRTWRWMTGTKHRCVTAFSSLDPLAPCHLKGRRPCWWQSVQLFFEWSTQVALQIILVRSHYAR